MAIFRLSLIFSNFFSIGIAVILTALPTLASPSLMLFPTRVIFEKNNRAFQIDLSNTGTEPGTYRITLENRRMTPEGQFVFIDQQIAGELSAEKIIQYSPRQVVLAPGTGQTIRVILRKPADLPVGEYRSHLVFTRLPDAATASVTNILTQKNESGVTITPLIGASIPIFIENGLTTASVKLSNLKYIKSTKKENALVEFKIEREGNRSVFGDLSVYFIPKGASEKEIARVKGIAVYSPYPFRTAKITIENENKNLISTGKLIIKYNEPQSLGGKLLSENSIDIP